MNKMGLKRKFERERLKDEYRAFVRRWKAERAYREWAGKETQSMGRKPTFSQWFGWMTEQKNKEPEFQQLEAPSPEIPELDWDDPDIEEKTGGPTIIDLNGDDDQA